MEITLLLVAAVLVIIAVSALAPKVGISPPLLLVVVGIGISFIPGLPEYQLNPEIVLIGILPPLLFSAAYNTSFVDFRANRGSILSLSVGLVIFTTIAIGFVAVWLIPGLPLAAGFALGALVAPPDAVAATAVARRVGMPKQIVSVLEGESLVNDATALTALRSATIAVGGTITVIQIGLSFLLAAGGGIVVGVLVALVFSAVRKRISNSSFDTVLTFTIPYVAFLIAEEIHASGVLAVVVAGILIGHKAPLLSSGTQRLTSESNWRTISFILENAVFLMIGLELRQIVENVIEDGAAWSMVISACLGVFVVSIVTRFVWVFGDGFVHKTFGKHGDSLDWPMRTVVSWAGMRGVVTLAAALALELGFPYRDLLILVASFVVVGSILIQGLSLPWLVKVLRLQAPDPAQMALQEAAVLDRARVAGLARLDEIVEAGEPEEVVERLRSRAELRSNDAWERVGRASSGGETPIQSYQRIRLDMLQAERAAVLAARDDGSADDDTIRRVIQVFDIEEAMLDRPIADQTGSQDDLISPETKSDICEHLVEADTRPDPDPFTAGVCDQCIVEGTTWVSLRICLTCGNVACCDSSSGRHAERHFHETDHPVMRSAEPGEAWRWCYVDRILG